ncbi:MAG: hypothetical protein Q9187_000786 [Circinaria calcarea]
MRGVHCLGALLSIVELLKPTAAASTVTVSINTAVCPLATSPFPPPAQSTSAVVVLYTTTNSEGSVVISSSTSFAPFSGSTGSRSVVIVYTSTGSTGNVFTSSTTSLAPVSASASTSAPFASIAMPPTSASSVGSSSSTIQAPAGPTSPCPASIAAVYQDPSGNDYQLFCTTDFLDNDIPAQTVSTFIACDSNLAYTNCYLKDAIENVIYGNGTKYSAKRASYNPPVGGVSVSVLTPSGSAASTAFAASSTSSVLSSMLFSSSFQTAASSSFTATSSSSSITSTSTSTGPSSTSSVQIRYPCPASDGQVYSSTGSPSQQYRIECGSSISDNDISALTLNTFEECIAACDSYGPGAQTPCVAVNWAPEFVNYPNCYLKSDATGITTNAQEDCAILLASASGSATSISTTISSASSIGSASSISSISSGSSTSTPTGTATLNCPASTFSPETRAPCPGRDGQDFTTTNGRTYGVSCGLALGNNDLPAQILTTFEECMNACDAYDPTTQIDPKARYPCTAVNWAPELRPGYLNCYLKSQVTISSPSCQEDSAILRQASPSQTAPGSGSSSTSVTPSPISSRAPVSSADAAAPCPGANNTVYQQSSTRSYSILCDVSLQNYDLLATNVYTFQECMAACDSYVPPAAPDPNSGYSCAAVNWAPQYTNYYNCFLKYSTSPTDQVYKVPEDSAILV